MLLRYRASKLRVRYGPYQPSHFRRVHPSDHHSCYKRCPHNLSDSLALNMHVHDGWYVTCSLILRQERKMLLEGRYGPIAFNDESTGVCGVRLTRHPDHSCTLDQGPHIKKFLHNAVMDLVPPALAPSTPTFFDSPSDTTSVDKTRFMRINGTLVLLLPIRHDIRKVLIHLCTRNSVPTQSDLSKQIHLHRYLKSCPGIDSTFSTTPAAFSEEGDNIHSSRFIPCMSPRRLFPLSLHDPNRLQERTIRRPLRCRVVTSRVEPLRSRVLVTGTMRERFYILQTTRLPQRNPTKF